MPNVSIANTGGAGQSNPNNGGLSYSFSNYSVGSFPKNGSWITFSVINNSSSFSDKVTGTSLGNGLDVFTSGMSQTSYLEMNISTFSSFTFYLNFSWNSNGYYGVTADNLNFYSGTTELFSTSFGPLDSFDTSIRNGTGSTVLGTEPPANAITNLYLSYNSTQPGLALLELKQAGVGIAAFPVRVNLPLGSISNLSLEIGGNYSNLTLYNFSEVDGANPLLAQTNSLMGFNSSAFPTSNVYSPEPNANVTPFMDSTLNSVVYYSTSGKLVSFDYYNDTFDNLTQSFGNLSGGIEYNGSVFYWQDNGSLTLTILNTKNLSVDSARTGIEMSGDIKAVFEGGCALFYNYTGAMVEYNLKTGTPAAYNNITLGGTNAGIRILSSGITANAIHFLAYSNSSRELVSCVYNLTGLTLYSENASEYSFLTGDINSTSTSSGASGSWSLFKVSDNTSQIYLAESSGNTYQSPYNSTFSKVLFVGATFSIISLKGNVYYLGDHGNLSPMGINASKEQYAMAPNNNLTEIIVLQNGLINIYYGASSIPLSNSRIKVTGKSTYLARGPSYLNFTVESNLRYTLTMGINGTTRTLHNSSSFLINSSLLENGTHTAYINGTNIAGYSSEFKATIEVDNAKPSLSLNIKNGSYISNSTLVSFSASDKVSISKITAEFLSDNLSFAGDNGTFDLASGNRTGNLTLSMSVTDIFGLKFNFSFYFIVVGSQAESSMNIWNGEYLNTTAVNLTWSNVGNATYYVVRVDSVNGILNTTTSLNSVHLNLPNGNDTVSLYSHLLDNVTVKTGMANVTVIAYAPKLNYSSIPAGIYSFSGNSSHDRFSTYIKSNITAELALSVTGPLGNTVYSVSGEDAMSVNITGNGGKFDVNGLYSLKVSATSLSGTISSNFFQMAVNNSVPDSPSVNGTVFYTRMPFVSVDLATIPGLNYTAELMHNGTVVGIEMQDLRNMSLASGTGNYTLIVTAYSESGNHNSTTANIEYYIKDPMISFSVPRNITNANYTYLHYSISDNVPIKLASLNINGSIRSLPLSETSMRLNFSHNGRVNLSITAVDFCGNANGTGTVTVNVSYYIHVISPAIRYSETGNIWHFQVYGRGNGLSRVNITWYVDGKEVSHGQNLNYTLGYGINTVKAVMKYQGKTMEVSRRVIVTGIIPFIAAPSAIAAVLVYRRLGTNRDPEEAREIILSGMGKPARDAVKAGKRRRIAAGAMRDRIRKLQANGELSLESDPDGVRYIMPPRNGSNGGKRGRG